MAVNKKHFDWRSVSVAFGLLTLIVVGFGIYYIWVQKDEIAAVNQALEQQEQRLAAYQKSLEDVRGLLRNYANVKSELTELSLTLPGEEDLPNLLVQLETLSLENSIMMLEMDHQVLTEDPRKSRGRTRQEELALEAAQEQAARASRIGYSTLQIDLTLEGKFADFMTYIESLQQNFRFLDLVDIKFDLEKAAKTVSTGEGPETEIPFEERMHKFKVAVHTYFLETE